MAEAPVTEELRLAVVLNGGVSLAVWIGGVTLEIDRLTRSDGVYGKLLHELGMTARADVITGTSAGGINGAALALAQVNGNADLRRLRDLWADQGRMETLLRTPFRGEPTSLLRGDDYFLPAIEQALRGLSADWEPREPQVRPVSLGITATLVDGARLAQSDALGQTLPQEVHGGLMTFRHLDQGRDDFAEEAIGETVRRLALAARTTASFPGAFEPSYLPVRSASRDPLGRPDMTDVVSWLDEAEAGDQSRFALDGGAMMNTPTEPALKVISELPAETDVRRMMLLVFPHAPVDAARPGALLGEAPGAIETVMAASRATRNEASRTHIDSLQAHNRRAGERRAGRADGVASIFRAADAKGESVAQRIASLAGDLFPHYEDLRTRRGARDLAGRAKSVRGWSYDRVLRAAQRAQTGYVDGGGRLPYLAAGFADAGVANGPDAWVFPEEPDAVDWPWGTTTALHMVEDVLDLTRRLLRTPLDGPARSSVQEQRRELFAARRRLAALRNGLDDVWSNPVLTGLRPDARYWGVWLRAYARALRGDTSELDPPAADGKRVLSDEQRRFLEDVPALRPGCVGAQVIAELRKVAAAAVEMLPAVRASIEAAEDTTAVAPADRDALAAWESLLAEPAGALLTTLVQLDTVLSCLAAGPEDEATQLVELVQVSLQTTNAFAQVTTTAADKLGGARLNRFAGFLKESWRVNDWMWGRLDAATMLCRVLLEPRRLRRALAAHEPDAEPQARAESWVAGWVATLFGDLAPGPGFAQVRRKAVREMAVHVFATVPPDDVPPTLENVAALFAWAIQADIASEDLPALRNAVLADRRDGAVQRSSGERLVADQMDLLEKLQTLGALPLGRHDEQTTRERAARRTLTEDEATRRRLGIEALQVFDRAGVGREPLQAEAAGDLFIRTGVTAAAVGATVLDSPRPDSSKLVRSLTKGVRGLTLLPYWVAQGLTRAGWMARVLAIAGLAGGATMLALALLISGVPNWMGLVGVSAVLFVFGYAAMRTGSLLHSVVLLLPALPLAAYAVAQALDDDQEPATVALLPFVVGLVVGVIVLGCLPGQVRTPLALLADWWVERRSSLAVVAVLLVVAIGGLGVLLYRDGGVVDLIVMAVVALLLAVLMVVAKVVSAGFRVRYYGSPSPGDRATWLKARVVHPTAVATAWASVYAGLLAFLAAWLWLGLRSAGTWTTLSTAHHWRSWGEGWSELAPFEWALVVGLAVAALAALAMAVGVFWLPRHAWARLYDSLALDARDGRLRLRPGDDEAAARAELLRVLSARGIAFVHLTRRGREADGSPSAATVQRARARAVAAVSRARTALADVESQLRVLAGGPETQPVAPADPEASVEDLREQAREAADRARVLADRARRTAGLLDARAREAAAAVRDAESAHDRAQGLRPTLRLSSAGQDLAARMLSDERRRHGDAQ